MSNLSRRKFLYAGAGVAAAAGLGYLSKDYWLPSKVIVPSLSPNATLIQETSQQTSAVQEIVLDIDPLEDLLGEHYEWSRKNIENLDEHINSYPGVNLNYENKPYSYIYWYRNWNLDLFIDNVVSSQEKFSEWKNESTKLSINNKKIISILNDFIIKLQNRNHVNVLIKNENLENDYSGSGEHGSRYFPWRKKEEIKTQSGTIEDFLISIYSFENYAKNLQGIIQTINLDIHNIFVNSKLSTKYKETSPNKKIHLIGVYGWFDTKRIAIEIQRQLDSLDQDSSEQIIENENEKALFQAMSSSAKEEFNKILDSSKSPYLAFYKRYFFKLMDSHDIRKEYAQHIEDVLDIGAYKVAGEEADRFFRIINPRVALHHNGDILDKFVIKGLRPENYLKMTDQQIFEAAIKNIPEVPYCREYATLSLREAFDQEYQFYKGEGDCTTMDNIATAAFCSICGREPGSIQISSTEGGTAHLVGMGFDSDNKEWMVFDGFSGVGSKHMVSLDEFLNWGTHWVPGPANYQIMYPFGPATLTRAIQEPNQDIQYMPVPPETV